MKPLNHEKINKRKKQHEEHKTNLNNKKTLIKSIKENIKRRA